MKGDTLTGRLTYNGNCEDAVGSSVTAPRLTREHGLVYVQWVVTDAVFDPATGKTTMEFDGQEVD